MPRVCAHGHPLGPTDQRCGECGAAEGALVEESAAALAEYVELLDEFLADAVLEDWELAELADARARLAISLATHERLLAERQRGALPLAVEIDDATLRNIEADSQCVLRLRVTNRADRAVRKVRLVVRGTLLEMPLECATRILGPAKNEIVSAAFAARAVGSHPLELYVEVTDMKGAFAYCRAEPLVFQVTRPKAGPSTSVMHIDAGSARVADFSGVKVSRSTAPGSGVLGEQWRAWALRAVTEVEFARGAGVESALMARNAAQEQTRRGEATAAAAAQASAEAASKKQTDEQAGGEAARRAAEDAKAAQVARATSSTERPEDDLESLLRLIAAANGRRSKELAVLHHRLAQALSARGDKNRMLTELELAWGIDPGNAPVLRDLGNLALEAGDFPKANKYFRALLLQKLDASCGVTKGQVFFFLGEVLVREGDRTRAIQMYERAVETEPTFTPAKERLEALNAAK